MSNVGGPLTQVNAPHLDQMGWLPDAAIQDVTVDGTYSIEATEIDPDAATYPQILRLEKPDTNEYYYVSFRRPIGLDANLIGYVNTYCDDTYLDLATVHRFRGFGFAPGYDPPNTYLVALLAEGDSFADTSNGITITMVSHEGHVATVRIGQ